MTRDDILQTLAILKAAYPSSFQVGGKPMPRRDAEALVSLWESQFAEEDPGAVRAAVEAMIATRTTGFSPTVGEIKDQLHKLRSAEGLTDAQAWNLVEKACRRGLYNSIEEFEKLPPDVQAAVGGPEQLKAWAAMDSETVNSVVASNFRRSFRTFKEREKETALLPPDVRKYIASVAESVKLGGDESKRRDPVALPLQPAALPAVREAERKPEPDKPKYEPLSEDEWERKREEGLRRLAALKG